VLFRSAHEYTLLGRALDVCAAQLPTNSPPEVYLNIARMYYEAKRTDKMAEYLQKFVERQPTDWKAWLDLASSRMMLGQTNAAVQALSQAVNYGGDEARSLIYQDERFAAIRRKLTAPARNLLGIPGAGAY
jgi:tetratricopeptide (TPR) repeat protein